MYSSNITYQIIQANGSYFLSIQIGQKENKQTLFLPECEF